MRINQKLFTSYAAVIILPILILSYFLFLNSSEAIKKSHLSSLENISDFKIKTIESTFDSLKRDITISQSFYNIKINLPVLIQWSDEKNNLARADAEKTLDDQLDPFKKNKFLLDIMLLNPEGKIVYCVDKKHEKENKGEEGSYLSQEVLKKSHKDIYLSDIFIINDKFEMFEIAPAYGIDKNFIGYIVFEIDMLPIYALIQDTIGLGETGETLIAKKTENGALYLNPLRYDKNAAFSKKVYFDKSVGIPAILAVQGKNGSGISTDYRGKKVIAAWRYISSLNWGLVAKIDTKEAFKSVNHLKRITFAVTLIVLLISTLVARFIAKSISEPIHHLHKGTEIIGQGNLDYRVATNTQDEIGQLSLAFDQMVTNLKRITASRDDLNNEITERKKIESKLNETVAELERSNRDLEQFAYISSHDLQEPLRMISSYLQLIQQRYQNKLDNDANDFINFAVNGAKRMKNLINDLLDYSRITTRGKPFNLTDCNIILNEVLSNLSISIANSGTKITSETLPKIAVDTSQIMQLLQNLISNSIKFRSKEPPHIQIACQKKETEWLFSVKDNGIGFEKEYCTKIFNIFHRLHTEAEYPGTGIGLAIAKKIAERHNGKIWAESEPGKGSVFYFTIPLF